MGVARAESAPLLRGIYLYTPYDALFVERLKDMVPYELRLWESDQKRWYVFESYAERAIDLARAYWPDIDLSGLDMAGPKGAQETRRRFYEQGRERVRGSGEYTWGKHQNTTSAAGSAPSSSDHATLYVTANAPFEVIAAAYKALALLHHPDNGGDTETMQRINGAYQRIKKAQPRCKVKAPQ